MKVLNGFSLADYQHEYDKGAFLDLQKVKAFDKAVDWVVENTIEKVTDVQQIGSSLAVNSNSTPELIKTIESISKILDIDSVPQIYTRWGYEIYITKDGDKHPKKIIKTKKKDKLKE